LVEELLEIVEVAAALTSTAVGESIGEEGTCSIVMVVTSTCVTVTTLGAPQESAEDPVTAAAGVESAFCTGMLEAETESASAVDATYGTLVTVLIVEEVAEEGAVVDGVAVGVDSLFAAVAPATVPPP